MLILLVLSAVTAFGLIRLSKDDLDFCGFLLGVSGGVLLFVAVTLIPLNRMGTMSGMAAFQAVQSTFESSRKNGVGIENAAIQIKVAEANQWLSSVKYWNGTVFDLWIPDSIESMEEMR